MVVPEMESNESHALSGLGGGIARQGIDKLGLGRKRCLERESREGWALHPLVLVLESQRRPALFCPVSYVILYLYITGPNQPLARVSPFPRFSGLAVFPRPLKTERETNAREEGEAQRKKKCRYLPPKRYPRARHSQCAAALPATTTSLIPKISPPLCFHVRLPS